jgi:hypothetical protein
MIKLINLLKETITEVSVEQLKAQFVDSGKISQKDFEEITNTTPKTAYITWLAKKVADKIIKPEDIYKYKKYFGIFDRRKKEYPFTDINQYKTQNDLSQFISKSVEISDKESEDVSQQKGVSKEDKYKEFYIGSVDGFNVYKLPEGRKDLYGASCELGSGTEWCTATGNTREHFDEYISEGPLFIFIKPGDKEKYQFSYETFNFMDRKDKKINKFKHINLFQFIEDTDPEYRVPFELKWATKDPKTFTAEDLNVKDSLDLTETNFTSLPDNLTVRGDLNIQGLKIKTLPKNLKVKGSLYADGIFISSIPEDLEVGEDLQLSSTPITSLPDNLKVNGDLDLSYTNLTSLPNNLKTINGHLSLHNTNLTSLPDNLKVKGSLSLSDTPIKTLPNGLEVGGNLIIYNTNISSFPKDIKVRAQGSINIKNTPLARKYAEEQIKQMYPGLKDCNFQIY